MSTVSMCELPSNNSGRRRSRLSDLVNPAGKIYDLSSILKFSARFHVSPTAKNLLGQRSVAALSDSWCCSLTMESMRERGRGGKGD